jgi:TolB protein
MRTVAIRTGLTGVLALVCLTVPTSATATFDGENGRIALRRFLDFNQTTGAIFTVRPDGSASA